MKLFYTFTLFFCITIAACQQPGASDATSTQTSENADSYSVPFTNADEFKTAQAKIGTANGTALSGEYSITSEGNKYTSDCNADFVKATDFFINKTLSTDEIEKILKNGGPPYSQTLTITQNGGKIVFKGIGDDDTDQSGAINGDGSYQIVFGSFLSKDIYYFSVYEGKIKQNTLSGTRKGFIKINHPSSAMNGSCSMTDTWAGTLDQS